jgi:hypothetical protein
MFRTFHQIRLPCLLIAFVLLWSERTSAQVSPLRFDTLQRIGDGFAVATEDGGRAELTLDARMQDATEEVLRVHQIPYAGAVVLSIPDGRVLAMVGRSAADPRLGVEELALRALGARGLRVQGRLGGGARRDGRRLGRDAHVLPRRRLGRAARQPRRYAGHRRPL